MLPTEMNGGQSGNDDESVKFGGRVHPWRTIVQRGELPKLQRQVLQLNSYADHGEASGAAGPSTSSE
jgi:hypothetical protein